MRWSGLSSIVIFISASALAQAQQSDEALLAKTRALYDAPFNRTLGSFDCAVEFDWKTHFLDIFGQIPPAAIPAIDRLQSLKHRIFVDQRSGATISEVPKGTDLSDVTHGVDLEKGFEAIVTAGVNAWLPFSTDVILPAGPTKFAFQKESADYKLLLNGEDIAATLTLTPELRILGGVSKFPQSTRFETGFVPGPNGYLLESLKTSSSPDPNAKWDATFSYSYKSVQGFELPSTVTITSSSPESWHFSLVDCKVTTGITIDVKADPIKK